MSKLPTFVERFRALDALDIKDGQITYDKFKSHIQKAGYTPEYREQLLKKFEDVSGGDCKVNMSEFTKPSPSHITLADMMF